MDANAVNNKLDDVEKFKNQARTVINPDYQPDKYQDKNRLSRIVFTLICTYD